MNNNARDWLEYRHKWVKICPSYLLSEHVDLSFYCFFFSKQCLILFWKLSLNVLSENIQGKFPKKFIGNFYFRGITLKFSSEEYVLEQSVIHRLAEPAV